MILHNNLHNKLKLANRKQNHDKGQGSVLDEECECCPKPEQMGFQDVSEEAVLRRWWSEGVRLNLGAPTRGRCNVDPFLESVTVILQIPHVTWAILLSCVTSRNIHQHKAWSSAHWTFYNHSVWHEKLKKAVLTGRSVSLSLSLAII